MIYHFKQQFWGLYLSLGSLQRQKVCLKYFYTWRNFIFGGGGTEIRRPISQEIKQFLLCMNHRLMETKILKWPSKLSYPSLCQKGLPPEEFKGKVLFHSFLSTPFRSVFLPLNYPSYIKICLAEQCQANFKMPRIKVIMFCKDVWNDI